VVVKEAAAVRARVRDPRAEPRPEDGRADPDDEQP
jgi:hypothetical protein